MFTKQNVSTQPECASPAPLSRREREKQRQRQEILDVALKLFSDKGYHHVSMHEIAREAEFAIGTLYKFFGNKEALYQALILQLSDRFHGALKAVIAGPGEETDILRAYVRVKQELFRDNAAAIRLYLAQTRGAGFSAMAGLDEEIRRRYRTTLQSLAAVFERGIRRRRFRRVASPFQLSTSLDSMVNAFLFLWIEDPDGQPFPDADTLLNILYQGLMPA